MTVHTTEGIKVNSVMPHSSLLLYNEMATPTCVYVCVCVSDAKSHNVVPRRDIPASLKTYVCLCRFWARARREFAPMKWDVHVCKSVVQGVSERQKTQTKQNEKMR